MYTFKAVHVTKGVAVAICGILHYMKFKKLKFLLLIYHKIRELGKLGNIYRAQNHSKLSLRPIEWLLEFL